LQFHAASFWCTKVFKPRLGHLVRIFGRAGLRKISAARIQVTDAIRFSRNVRPARRNGPAKSVFQHEAMTSKDHIE
jgi:hypothetical protein